MWVAMRCFTNKKPPQRVTYPQHVTSQISPLPPLRCTPVSAHAPIIPSHPRHPHPSPVSTSQATKHVGTCFSPYLSTPLPTQPPSPSVSIRQRFVSSLRTPTFGLTVRSTKLLKAAQNPRRIRQTGYGISNGWVTLLS